MIDRSMDVVDSKIPWIGKIPISWNVKPLWSMYERIKDVDHPDEQMLSVFRDYGVVAKDSRNNTNQTADNRSIYQLVHPGWLVTNRMKAWQGSVGISRLKGIVSGHYICFTPRHDENHDYLNWLFRSPPYTAGYKTISRGVRPGQAEIDNDHYRLLPVIVPPLAEQKAIATYLDHETEQIDTLINEQQRLVEMLRERRQAVIDHAFAELSKERIQLRRFTRFLTSGSRGWGAYYSDFGDVFIRIGNLPRGSLSLGGEVQRVDLPPDVNEGHRTKVEAGDLLFSITAYIGSVAVVDEGWTDSYVSQHVALCRLDRSVLDPEFTGYFMLTTEGQDQLSEGAVGGTKVQLALDDIRALRVAVPPLDAQRQIAKHLNRETCRIDTLIAESERLIELSKERRAALISAAVTGQIKVR
ncbi:restriction endonuclease subunit S [Streptomyces sp. WA6-1-16]|uniref:restriction endonuclease subunit S n=1 Tax=Streptomyces sp. WA6-1-16 TaxID=2879427 RepID=UPI001CE37AFF|nr:restriction endonuclease subunit S [Streptomyces sp. WA6-1-16]UCA47983.1 restriction endonuclease subunit S [Streptomyces sp. WA6-1-16]